MQFKEDQQKVSTQRYHIQNLIDACEKVKVCWNKRVKCLYGRSISSSSVKKWLRNGREVAKNMIYLVFNA
jgi:hypothetical protein